MGLIKENKYLIFGIIVLLILLWWTRFQIVGSLNYAYRLDRLKSKIEIIEGGVILGELRTLEELKKEYPAQEPKPAPPPDFNKK